MSSDLSITVTVNGQEYQRTVEARLTLVDFIRESLELTGTHVGCEHGACGACTILFNGDAVRSCLMLAVQADGASITTVEGLSSGDELNPLQQAFHQNYALQCGFCTPGLLITATAFLKENPSPTEEEIKEAISGNICRCTGYEPIIRAIGQASRS